MKANWVVAALLSALSPGLAAAERAQECAGAPNGAICHEIVVPASTSEVWRLFSSDEGLSSWMAPVAAIDLRVGGLLESSYTRTARIGDAGNIQNRILSYLPERMLSIGIERAPPNFPHADVARTLWTVIELDPADATHTRVRVTMLGYGEGEAFDALHRHFNAGNAWTLEKLRERVAEGPVDWAALGSTQ